MTTDKELKQKLQDFVAAEEPGLIQDTFDLIAIPSLRAPATSEYPFGEACAKALDHALALAESYGFEVENNNYYYGSCLLKGTDGSKEIGIACHLDIVAAQEADGWTRPPFEGHVDKGYIIGRGATDNKGPLVAALYTLRFLKEQGERLKNDVRLIFGCDEESGMEDMEYLKAHAERQPAFVLVPDGPFPVCYAQKGRIEFTASTSIVGGNLAAFWAGEEINSIPGNAWAVVSGISLAEAKAALPKGDAISVQADGENVRIMAIGVPKHASTPDGAVNAAHKLAAALAESGLLTAPADWAVKGLASFSSDYHGAGLGISAEDDILGKLTHCCSMIRTGEGRLTLGVDIRYPIAAVWEDMRTEIKKSLAAAGYSCDSISNSGPHYMPKDTAAVQQLCAIANEQMGTTLEPAIMAGGTYARKFPAALTYGPSRPDFQKPFPPGHGWAHQVDEAVRIKNLTDQICAYVPALLYLDEVI